MAVKRKPIAEKLKELKQITTAFNKEAGETRIDTVANPDIYERIRIEYIPTASLKLNSAIGGGWPRGKFSLISGAPDSGKTYRLLEDIAHNMKLDPDFMALWVESESSISEEVFDMFGIDRERMFFYEVGTDSGEEALDLVIRYAYTGVDMIVINSLKCLTPEKEFKDSMSDANVAIQARMNAKFMRVIIPTIAESGTALCIVQHQSTDIGSYMGGQTITGGKAIRYNNVLTVEFRKAAITSGHPLYSVKDDYMLIKAKVTKNHCKTTTNPYVTIEYTVKLGEGTDTTGEIVEEAFNQKILEKAGAWIREYEEGKPHEKGNERILSDGTKASWNGMAKFTEYLNNNPDYFNYLKTKVENNVLVKLEAEEAEALESLENLDTETAEFIKNIEEKLDIQ